MSRPTLRDVAAKAGLSVTQVSRALNDHDDVAETTKQLARKVAEELNYIPNLEARRLRDPGARTGTIGVILPTESLRFSDPFFGDLVAAMAAEASSNGLQLNLSSPPAGTHSTAPYDRAIRGKQVDGFVIVRTESADDRIDFLLQESFPFVAFGRPAERPGFPAVEATADCFAPAVAHLVEFNHSKIACIAEPSQFAIGAARLASFKRAIADHVLTIDDRDIVEAGFHERSGYDAAIRILSRADRPTALVAMNDLLALGALDAAASLGLSVPSDVSVIGYDDIQAARQVRPSLTTLHQSASDVGSLLVRELLVAINSPSLSHSQATVQSTLVVRESTGPAPETKP